jgi:hypothetical protein
MKVGMKKGAEAMLLIFYSDAYTSNGVGANAPKKGIALIPFVKGSPYPTLKEHRSDTI